MIRPDSRHGRLCLLPLLLALLALAGCDVLSKGKQEAVYKLPKDARVLVFVDPRHGADIPVDVPMQLGQQISDHLYKYNVSDKFVSQQELMSLRADSEKFSKMAIEDVAVATHADIVLYVDMLSFSARATSEGQITEGAAQALVKVLDGKGNRLWPVGVEVPGAAVTSVVPPKFSEEQDLGVVKRKLIDDLAVFIGRTFHGWEKDDKYLAR